MLMGWSFKKWNTNEIDKRELLEHKGKDLLSEYHWEDRSIQAWMKVGGLSAKREQKEEGTGSLKEKKGKIVI